jgi:hypothetical protein
MSMAVSGSKALSAVAVVGVRTTAVIHIINMLLLLVGKGMLLNESLIVLALLRQHGSPLNVLPDQQIVGGGNKFHRPASETNASWSRWSRNSIAVSGDSLICYR